MKNNDIYKKNQYLNSSINLPTMLWWNWNNLMHLMNYNGSYWFHTTGRKMTYAIIRGGPLAPNISGVVYFVDIPEGTQVCANINGLPPYQPATINRPPIGPHGFHIHEHGTCEIGDPTDPFQAAGGHWNPDNQPHGNVSSLVTF